MIISIIKIEKDSLGINYPIIYSPSFEQNNCGGACSIDYNPNTKRDEITIRINYPTVINNFISNQNNQSKNSDRGLETLFELTATICHEMRHAYQKTQMLKHNSFDYNAMLWLKESIVLSEISPEIYNKNHNNWLEENDSYKYMYDRAVKYINNYFPTQDMTAQQKESLNHLIISKKKYTIMEPLLIDIDGQKMKVEEYINIQMRKCIVGLSNNAISSTLLRYEYNSDGTKKTYIQLMSDKEKLIDSLDKNEPNYKALLNSIEQFYNDIIANDKNLQEQSLQNQHQKTPEELYDEAFKKRAEYAQTIEQLMAIKSNYSEEEYNQRLSKLMQGRDSAQKQMDKYFETVHRKNNFEMPSIEDVAETQSSESTVQSFDEKEKTHSQDLRETVMEFQKRGFEIPKIDDIFEEQFDTKIEDEHVEGRKIR